MMNSWIAQALALFGLVGQACAADRAKPFLFLKTGEKFATQETAGQTVATLTDYLGGKLGDKFEPHVMNDPAKASEFSAARRPPLGIVTPGFYLTYAKALGMEPLLETRRQNVAVERFVLVVKKSVPDDLDALKGKVIAASLAAEERYLVSVVLQGKLGEEVRLKPTTDIEGAAFDISDNAKNAADAVLMEEEAWKVFEKDEELGPKLKAIYQSGELPRDLVVVFRPNAAGLAVAKAKTVLQAMSSDAAGKQILDSIRVEAFTEVNSERLAKAQELFHAK
jgi:ABC-type phosphate/phosphonate transport system substrate-binding protein